MPMAVRFSLSYGIPDAWLTLPFFAGEYVLAPSALGVEGSVPPRIAVHSAESGEPSGDQATGGRLRTSGGKCTLGGF